MEFQRTGHADKPAHIDWLRTWFVTRLSQMESSARELWNCEYHRRGIPSSYRDEPSTVLKWALNNWPLLAGHSLPTTALDSGCGAGRNARYLADHGVAVVGLELSDAAITECRRQRQSQQPPPVFVHCDVTMGLPLRSAHFDMVCDIFVYKHIVDSEARTTYRREISRVLTRNGRVLLSLAEARDEYYAGCPDIADRSSTTHGSTRVVLDPVAGVQSVLFSFDALVAEMSDHFVLDMCWHREQPGLMHGKEYLRRTMATLWRPRQDGHGPNT